MNIVGIRLKELRKELGKSQQVIADDLKISQSTYAGYEVNRNEPGNEMLVILSDYFDVSIDYLLGHSNIKATQAEVDFSNEVGKKGIEQMIKEYNISLGDESMDQAELIKLIKLIKLFMDSD